MAEFIAYFNGEYVPYSEVRIDPDDLAIMGDSVFDVERTFDGRLFRLEDHIGRLYRSLRYSRIDPGLSPREMMDISEETVSRNELLRKPGSDFLVRQLITRGHGGDTPPTVLVSIPHHGTGAIDSHIDFSQWAGFYGATPIAP